MFSTSINYLKKNLLCGLALKTLFILLSTEKLSFFGYLDFSQKMKASIPPKTVYLVRPSSMSVIESYLWFKVHPFLDGYLPNVKEASIKILNKLPNGFCVRSL